MVRCRDTIKGEFPMNLTVGDRIIARIRTKRFEGLINGTITEYISKDGRDQHNWTIMDCEQTYGTDLRLNEKNSTNLGSVLLQYGPNSNIDFIGSYKPSLWDKLIKYEDNIIEGYKQKYLSRITMTIIMQQEEQK